MGSRSRRRRSLFGTRESQARADQDPPEPESVVADEDVVDPAGDEPGRSEDGAARGGSPGEAEPADTEPSDPESPAPLETDGSVEPPRDVFGADEIATEQAPAEPSEPSEPNEPADTDAGPTTDEAWSPPPHWPAVRFVDKSEMLRGFHRSEDEDAEPLLEEWELRTFVGLALLGIGATLLGGGMIFGLWLVLGSQLWQAWAAG